MSERPQNNLRLETRVDLLEHGVGELKKAVGEQTTLLRDFIQQASSAPRPIPYREIVGSVAATLAIVWGLLSFGTGQVQQMIHPVRSAVERLEKSTDTSEAAVLRYRIGNLERIIEKLPRQP